MGVGSQGSFLIATHLSYSMFIHASQMNQAYFTINIVLMGDITIQITAQWDAQSGFMALQLFIAKNRLQTACMYIPCQSRQPVDI